MKAVANRLFFMGTHEPVLLRQGTEYGEASFPHDWINLADEGSGQKYMKKLPINAMDRGLQFENGFHTIDDGTTGEVVTEVTKKYDMGTPVHVQNSNNQE